ncbi:hypothetical protein K7G98_18115 [Saccharothrix sp. MB29]|nr:hypothetical protein [Saccharothrix sp. MB29]
MSTTLPSFILPSFGSRVSRPAIVPGSASAGAGVLHVRPFGLPKDSWIVPTAPACAVARCQTAISLPSSSFTTSGKRASYSPSSCVIEATMPTAARAGAAPTAVVPAAVMAAALMSARTAGDRRFSDVRVPNMRTPRRFSPATMMVSPRSRGRVRGGDDPLARELVPPHERQHPPPRRVHPPRPGPRWAGVPVRSAAGPGARCRRAARRPARRP